MKRSELSCNTSYKFEGPKIAGGEIGVSKNIRYANLHIVPMSSAVKGPFPRKSY